MAKADGFNASSLIGSTVKRSVVLGRAGKEKPVYDRENRTVELAFFSDEPQLDLIGRTLVYVKLSMETGAANLERYDGGLAFTENHDIDRRLGKGSNPNVVARADGKGNLFRSTGFFTDRPYADELFNETIQLIDKGFFPDTSGIARIDDVAPQPIDKIDGIPVVLATKWTPMEMCIATLGKDNNTGVGRTAGTEVQRGMGCSCACCTPQNPRACCCCCPDLTAPPPYCNCACCNSTYAQTCCCCCDALAHAAMAQITEEGAEPDAAATRTFSQHTPATKRSAPMTIAAKTNPQDPPVSLLTTATERQTAYESFAIRYGSTDEQKAELKAMANGFALAGKPEQDLLTEISRITSEWDKSKPNVPPAMRPPTFDAREASEITERYSISRAIVLTAGMKHGGEDLGVKERSCFEFDISQELNRRYPRVENAQVGDFRMPLDVPLRGLQRNMVTRSGLDTQTPTKGSELVFAEYQTFIDVLRNRARVAQMGAQIITGLRGNPTWPRQASAGQGFWVGENPGSDVADSDLGLDQIQSTPKTFQSSSSYSRQLLVQNVGGNIDNIVQSDQVQINALEVDRVSIHGSGSGHQPRGVYNTSGVNSTTFISGGVSAPITYSGVVDMETAIDEANADVGTMGYLTTPGVKGTAKKTAQLANTIALPIWQGDEMNGYRALSTNQVSKTLGAGSDHGMVFGVWQLLMILEWGGALEVIVDPYRLKKQGMIETTTFLMADILLRHPQAFSIAVRLSKS